MPGKLTPPFFIVKVTREHDCTFQYLFLTATLNSTKQTNKNKTRNEQRNKKQKCIKLRLPFSTPAKTKSLCRIKVNFKAKLRKHGAVESRADSAHRVVLGYSNNWKKVHFLFARVRPHWSLEPLITTKL